MQYLLKITTQLYKVGIVDRERILKENRQVAGQPTNGTDRQTVSVTYGGAYQHMNILI